MSLRLVQRQAPRQSVKLEQLAVAGGASTTVFPLVESWLQESTDHWNALRAISKRKVDAGFHSVVDFVFVSVCPSFRQPCLDFYAGDGPPLRDLVMEPERRYFERRILAFLEVAYAAFSSKRQLSWASAVEIINLVEVA
jgi:hypothetical protein